MPNKELLFSLTKKDFVVETFRGSGAGGQKRNKTDSCVRITHPDSGAVGYCCETPSQHQNKRKAFERLTESTVFKMWHAKKCLELSDQAESIEDRVNRLMQPEYLKVEIKDEEGNWSKQ